MRSIWLTDTVLPSALNSTLAPDVATKLPTAVGISS